MIFDAQLKAGAPVFPSLAFEICDQYTIQGEKFSDAIINDLDVPVSLEDAYKNTSVLEAIFESEKKGTWIELEK